MNEPTSQPSPEQARSAAASIVAPDAATAELLAKHAAGEKLSQSEYGKLGAFAAIKKKLFGKSDAPGQPTLAGNGNANALASVASAQASADSLPDVEVDPGLCQRTTSAVLARYEAICRRKLTTAAKLAYPNTSSEEMARLNRSAGLPADDKTLIVDLSPDALRELGVNPRKYPLLIIGGVLGLHATEMWLAIDEFHQKAKEREQRERTATPQTTPPAVTLAQSLTPKV